MDPRIEQTDQSSIEMNQRSDKISSNAIVIRQAIKQYSQSTILDNLNMTVSRGSIYALLGASGCGKTTLLSCIVGLKKLDQGDIWVLGGKPGDKNSGVPGPRIGYMPQDISLVYEFSTIDALYYFGRINGVKDDIISEKYDFYADLLHLPPKNCPVKKMSGGQQRRVSLAASLLHDPELLILDEPTVGLDSILREKIWNFFINIAEEKGVAVLITTHYIEEAKRVNRIGLMRNGKLLAETTPTNLLSAFQCSTLEEAFLILSQKQEENQELDNPEIHNDLLNELQDKLTEDPREDSPNKAICDSRRSTCAKGIFKALIIKNLLQFVRDPGIIALAIVFPIMMVAIFFNAVGGDPKNLVVAIVNKEAGNCNFGENLGTVIFDPINNICDYINISCKFLNSFDETSVKKQYFDTLEEATLAVRSGKAHGTIYFSSNFSFALQHRRDDPLDLSDEEIDDSSMQIVLDMSDVIGLFLQRKFLEQFLKTHGEIVDECNIPKQFTDIPIHFEEPIFGKVNQKYSDFMAPGYVLTATAFLATTATYNIVIADREQGVWDRSLVQGVTQTTILLSHFFTQFFIIVIQVILFAITTFWYYELTCKGSLLLIILFFMLAGLWGMSFGFLVSILCENHTVANYIVTGSLYTMILLCGIIWPVEGMPTFVGWISYFMPMTLASQSFRNILEKEYSLDNFDVYNGILVVSGWIIGLFVCCLFGFRRKTT